MISAQKQRKGIRKGGPAQRKIGRPYGTFKKADTTKLIADVAGGVPVDIACAADGIHRDTFYSWLDQRPQLAQALAAEKRKVILETLGTIKGCSTKEREFRNLAWFLERVYPDAFAPKPPNVALGVQQNFTITVEQARHIEDMRTKLLPRVNERFAALINGDNSNGTGTEATS